MQNKYLFVCLKNLFIVLFCQISTTTTKYRLYVNLKKKHRFAIIVNPTTLLKKKKKSQKVLLINPVNQCPCIIQ